MVGPSWRFGTRDGLTRAASGASQFINIARRCIRRQHVGQGRARDKIANIDQSPGFAGGEGRRKSAHSQAQPGWRLGHGSCFERDPPEEPPSEEQHCAEGRSPGSRVNAVVPAFPSFVQKLSDTKWNRYSPLTVAGAAPDSAQKGRHRLPVLAPPSRLRRGTSTICFNTIAGAMSIMI